jgi:hypothetical protein
VSSDSSTIGMEPVIWARLMQSQKSEIPPEVARYLLSVEFGEGDRERMRYLADQSEEGALTPEEEAEFDSYLHVGNLLAVMQSKARVVLGHSQPTTKHW